MRKDPCSKCTWTGHHVGGSTGIYIASTVFDLVSLAGITGTMEPRGIFSMAVPAEVLAAALAEEPRIWA